MYKLVEFKINRQLSERKISNFLKTPFTAAKIEYSRNKAYKRYKTSILS